MRIAPLVLAGGLALTTTCSSTPRFEESPVTGGSSSALVATAAYGVVRNPDGAPAIGVLITPTSLDGHAVPELAVTTDRNGAYEWPLKAGRYRLDARNDLGAGSTEVTITAGERARADLDLRP